MQLWSHCRFCITTWDDILFGLRPFRTWFQYFVFPFFGWSPFFCYHFIEFYPLHEISLYTLYNYEIVKFLLKILFCLFHSGSHRLRRLGNFRHHQISITWRILQQRALHLVHQHWIQVLSYVQKVKTNPQISLTNKVSMNFSSDMYIISICSLREQEIVKMVFDKINR